MNMGTISEIYSREANIFDKSGHTFGVYNWVFFEHDGKKYKCIKEPAGYSYSYFFIYEIIQKKFWIFNWESEVLVQECKQIPFNSGLWNGSSVDTPSKEDFELLINNFLTK